ncbi:FecR domain-containing protein [Chitinophaga pendula]|uniref:FecR family protein n=1 Tax=Chitinophaga TaxID=79328 RepID=UPI000BB06179|nr:MULTISPECIES: FecR domain-containing protein [Chitinophaga]ASZ12228.1 hypothetical protein CK934_15295 [Chitinophaga sp. MD30]UCJ04740.1 FecR domain-containing protein [Chitinophaga pendula]
MKREDITEFIIECLSHPEDANRQTQLSEWLAASPDNQETYTRIRQLWNTAADIPGQPFPAHNVWEELEEHIRTNTPRQHPSPPVWTTARKCRVAAAILLPALLAVYFWQQYIGAQEWEFIRAHANIIDSVHLPDGSKVYLKPGTGISFNSDMRTRRVVRLMKGEAFFVVAKDEHRKFIVEGQNTTIRVLGTSFNLYTADTATIISVKEGSIRVNGLSKDQSIVLQSNEEVYVPFQGEQLNKRNIMGDTPGNWTRQSFHFDDQPLCEVIRQLSAYYHVRITITDNILLDKRVTVHFRKESLAEMLNILAEMLNAKVTTGHGISYELSPQSP